MLGAVAEYERSLIRERTRAGLAAAKARGRVGGNPKLKQGDTATVQRLADRQRQLYLLELTRTAEEWLPDHTPVWEAPSAEVAGFWRTAADPTGTWLRLGSSTVQPQTKAAGARRAREHSPDIGSSESRHAPVTLSARSNFGDALLPGKDARRLLGFADSRRDLMNG
ncbi:recombinase family protein [Azospirillum brasilense]|uniref:recombinase family protein n=1 Tax=Azospirillum brasilense TaxID=192 RepID=UPI0024950739|nr:recombinase family protein [Azospirillum brasilense]